VGDQNAAPAQFGYLTDREILGSALHTFLGPHDHDAGR
jgi:hypothetical protein